MRFTIEGKGLGFRLTPRRVRDLGIGSWLGFVDGGDIYDTGHTVQGIVRFAGICLSLLVLESKHMDE